MRQSLTQQRPAGVALPDSVGSFNRRKRNSLYVTVTLLIVSVLILTVGLAATTRTQNVTVGGYYPGVIVSIELLAAQSLIDTTGEAEAEGSVISRSQGAFTLLRDYPHLHNYISEYLSCVSVGNVLTCGWMTDLG
ncbi:hypothetical protein DUI87_15139 [Hirundo rustica rustica]|uniref:Transmembrane protein 255A n=1 Tax=Hirundo rustica rustica TaxID=333673 RepID=A0A3M0KLM9_HIRRU|nr:hypothetical protein DUI87_15139 [Hirundo rustica rustica]